MPEKSRDREINLSIVMPVYNEGDVIGAVVSSWADEMERLGIKYEYLIYDAGSSDGTLDVLADASQNHPQIRVTVCPKLPHGPSICRGYREARGQWVLQIDSDNEMGPECFHKLWEKRHGHDLLLGYREGRQSPLVRRIVTSASRAAVRLLFGRGVWDVNSPYRLIRLEKLQALLCLVPGDSVAPNVILSGLAVKGRLRIYQCSVPHRSRRVGTAPLTRFGLWKVAAKALIQTLWAAFRSL